MQQNDNDIQSEEIRGSFLLPILGLYLLPLTALIGYTLMQVPSNIMWSTFAIGLIFAIVGSIIFYVLLQRFESKAIIVVPQPVYMPPKVIQEAPKPPPAPPAPDPREQERLITEAVIPLQHKNSELLAQLENKESEFAQLRKEKEQVDHQLQALVNEFSTFHDGVQVQIDQKDELICQIQQTISEQRALIEKHQQHIGILETKEKDLSYEIKTLLQLSSLESVLNSDASKHPQIDTNENRFMVEEEVQNTYRPQENSAFQIKQVDTPEAAASQLKLCLDIATKMSGANYLIGGTSRLHHFPVDNYALDLRRLCDSLNSENSSLVLLYSRKDNKLLFVNDLAKHNLGWSADKFCDGFSDIIGKGIDEWKRGLNLLTTESRAIFPLNLRSKNGQDMSYHCHLGTVPAGTFRHHIIGVLYQK